MELEKAILDLLAYFAVLKLPLAEAEINHLVAVKTSHLAVRDALKNLLKEHEIRIIGDCYGLRAVNYLDREDQLKRQAKLLAKVHRWSYLFRMLPYVKAVVAVNSTAMGNVHDDSDIDLLIVTKPNRIYLSKGVLMYGLRFLRRLETAEKKAGQFSLGMFLTTAGVNFSHDFMETKEPHLLYWLIEAKPIYGSAVWYGLLKKDSYVLSRLPNYIWPKTGIKVYGGGLKSLDAIDNRGFRVHLRHTSKQVKNSGPRAFIRIRPDVLNLHALDSSSEIAEKYQKIRVRYKWHEDKLSLTEDKK